MLYHTNEAREAARKDIQRYLIKLATLKPTDDFDLQDIRSTRWYLKVLQDGIQSEIYKANKIAHEEEAKRRANA